ncbi:MAG: aldo/keto reductase [Lachnospiraceae bacterium]|nr:aldo/keto reductase [Lachnospiraceae bacterium]
MQYRKNKNGADISLLGYGCMRFTRKGNSIDLEKAQKELAHAIENGVNYFDTAYIYPGSEAAIGEIFHRLNCREQIYIATKLPHYLIKSMDGIEKIFQEELKRLQTDYVDYYLMHMLTDTDTWEKLKALGIEEWIREKKESGQIRNIGFSYHGHTDMFCKLIDAYDWDFTQIQYNYMDEHSQAGRKGLHYAAAKKIPVIIMEPLRGGKLVNLLPEKAKKLIAEHERGYSAAEWAFRWLYDQPEVTCVLSGMNSMEMLEENLRIANETQIGAFTEADFALIDLVKAEIESTVKVGCTGCGYCMPCPKGVDIPETFRCYNNYYAEGKRVAIKEYMQCTLFRKNHSNASNCVECGLCEKHCPQHIEIRKELKNAANKLESPVFKFVKWAIKTFKMWG